MAGPVEFFRSNLEGVLLRNGQYRINYAHPLWPEPVRQWRPYCYEDGEYDGKPSYCCTYPSASVLLIACAASPRDAVLTWAAQFEKGKDKLLKDTGRKIVLIAHEDGSTPEPPPRPGEGWKPYRRSS